MPETADRTESVFAAVVALSTPAERAAYLDQACADDPDLRARLEALLRAHDRAGHHLDRPVPGDPDRTGEFVPSEAIGTVIAGRYKLLEAIGEGGMGTVFVAEQTQPVRRKVAVKLIKAGMDSKTVLARFEAERQALAMMDHPNIAKVLDGGLTEAGRPYFVMEYVKGVPITEYCDATRLSVPERLQLFVQVCQAVQHAHQKGIIHRDLKPSNILVAPYDGTPVPKVIDFGLAKAMHHSLTERTLHTAHETVLGTPRYMSPEQAQLNNLDVDTRSDIYSLGVLHYELLTGSTPLEKQRFKEAAWDEIRRIIREEEPPRPSTRLSSANALPSLAACRHTEPAGLTKLVRGELDWIAMKALDKDRNRRYETANGFAMDVQRYLAGEAVLAVPPSAGYRLRKLLRRNKGPVLAAGLVLLTLVGGVVGTSLGLVRAENARQGEECQRIEAEEARRGEEQQRIEAERNAREARDREAETRAVLEFMEKTVLAAARPAGQEGGLGPEVTLRRAMEAAVPVVDQIFKDQPLIEARLRTMLGRAFLYSGDERIAAKQFELARSICARILGPDHADTLASMENLALSYALLGRYVDALKLYKETLTLQKAKLGAGPSEAPRGADDLADTIPNLGPYADVLRLHEEALALMKTKLGADHPQRLKSMHSLAVIFGHLGRHAEAVKLNEEVLAIRRARLGPDHTDTLGSMANLANGYEGLGRHNDALKLREETLALQKVRLGPDHRNTLGSMNNLANSYADLGRLAEAHRLYGETLALRKAKLGADHPDTLASMSSLANSYAGLGRHAEAHRLYEETLALRKAKLGPDHPDTLTSMKDLAKSLLKIDRGREAVAIIDECIQRATGNVVYPRLIPALMDSRLRHFEKSVDAVGCRKSAEMWENLNRADANSLYAAACMRAVTARVIKEAKTPGADAARLANEEADRAMAWLHKTVAAGYKNAAHMKKDKDLDPLRDRADFKKLLDSLPKAKEKDNPH